MLMLTVFLMLSCQEDLLQVILHLDYSIENTETLHKDLTIIVFIDIECPISQYVIKPMNVLQEKYVENVKFIGLLPGDYYSEKQKNDFISELGVNFELKDDPKLKVVKRVDATVTPQCFLLDESGKILYNGALDNKYEALGKAKPLPSIDYLDLAINQILSGKQVELSATKPIGCLIER